jgi:1-acyl-sn-glycerol-3-phosphate acyltransferase
METKRSKSFLKGVPSWGLVLMTLIIVTIVYYISDSLMTSHTQTGIISNVINDLMIATGCFFIVRRDPKSIWYVPLILNAGLIISSCVEPLQGGNRILRPF